MTKTVTHEIVGLRALPSVDQLLRLPIAEHWHAKVGNHRLTMLARTAVEELRARLIGGTSESRVSRADLLDEAIALINKACEADENSELRRVINATGVIIHTNLGRAPLSDSARAALVNAAGYCTVEFDLSNGTRGKRGGRVEELLTELTGAEAALIVNNCAAAALLILSVMASDGETIVSRGELVEIGGDFRVPDVMGSSGTTMIEVGTTNRTNLEDYRRAINDHTRLIMRVHPSNYRIVGFTASPSLPELSNLAHEHGLPLYEDAGSGLLQPLEGFRLTDEPVVSASLAMGADLVSFSGDKLLGGCQAGLIVGKEKHIARLRKHPIYRALRADKLAFAVLEATLKTFRRDNAVNDVPVLKMLSLSKTEIESRARKVVDELGNRSSAPLEVTIVDGESAIGGGAGPNTHPPTALIAVKHEAKSADQIETALRFHAPPIIGRIADGYVLLDLRTVRPEEDAELLSGLQTILT